MKRISETSMMCAILYSLGFVFVPEITRQKKSGKMLDDISVSSCCGGWDFFFVKIF